MVSIVWAHAPMLISKNDWTPSRPVRTRRPQDGILSANGDTTGNHGYLMDS